MLAEPIAQEDAGHSDQSPEVHSELERYDGSRTPPEVQFQIMMLHNRQSLSPHAIGQILKMNPRTIKAVIAADETSVSTARMLLKAHDLYVAEQAMVAVGEAAKRGKLEGITAYMDRRGITEPPKNQAQTQIGVSVVLNGGPEPVSLAKVDVQSEGRSEQAQIPVSPISHLMDTASLPVTASQSSTCEPHVNITVMADASDAPAAGEGR